MKIWKFCTQNGAYIDSENELSGDEIIDNVGQFDLINVNQADWNELERQWRNIVGDSDDEDD